MTVIAGEYRFGPDNSRLVLKTTRAGLASKAGHDLTIEVTRWSAHAAVPDEDQRGLAAATISAQADLSSLTTREGTGGAVPLTQSDCDEIDKTARRILAGRTATATFESAQITVQPGGGEIEGTLTLNGVSRPLQLQVTEHEPGRYRGTGTVVQSAHDIKPYSAFLGALKLRDEVTLEIEIDLAQAQPDLV